MERQGRTLSAEEFEKESTKNDVDVWLACASVFVFFLVFIGCVSVIVHTGLPLVEGGVIAFIIAFVIGFTPYFAYMIAT